MRGTIVLVGCPLGCGFAIPFINSALAMIVDLQFTMLEDMQDHRCSRAQLVARHIECHWRSAGRGIQTFSCASYPV